MNKKTWTTNNCRTMLRHSTKHSESPCVSLSKVQIAGGEMSFLVIPLCLHGTAFLSFLPKIPTLSYDITASLTMTISSAVGPVACPVVNASQGP